MAVAGRPALADSPRLKAVAGPHVLADSPRLMAVVGRPPLADSPRLKVGPVDLSEAVLRCC
jgi:hypothetical protein